MSKDGTETVRADVIVIGAGGSGLATAVTAADGGAKVVVFEKMAAPGGTSVFFQGMFAAGSELQRERYIDYTTDEAFKNMMDYSHWKANPRLVRAFVDESGPTISWLQGLGVEFPEATINMPNGIRTYHLIKRNGAAVVKALTTQAKELDVDIRLGAPVRELIKEDGTVVGVIAEEKGKIVEAYGKAVVIATGGYGANAEWMKKFTGLELGVNVIPIAQMEKVGDGIRMAWEAGADEKGKDVLLGMRVGPMGPGITMGNTLECASAQPDLWVTQQGERFCDEALEFNDAVIGAVAASVREGYSFTIFDEAIKEEMIAKGIERSLGNTNWPGTRLTNFEEDLKEAFAQGNTNIYVADSIEELASKIGVDPNTLRETVEEYNRCCDDHRDSLFAKPRKYLRPIRKPKFYAIKAFAIFLGTLGGIRINHRLEAVDKAGDPIPGLYAVGNDAGGIYGDMYPMAGASGAASAWTINSGRLAGKSVLKYLGR